MVNGYAGKVLRVNLTNSNTTVEQPGEDFYRRYVGGRGFVCYYLLKEMTGKEDPLGPENKLVFATGVLTGVPAAGSGRNSVGAKSPLTDGYGDTEAGGYWGAELKHAGYDVLIVEGKAASPVYLWIKDGNVEIRDARHLWGKAADEVEKIIKEELTDDGIRVAQIGIAGENLVRYACVVNDLSHLAGRTGMGAVMGSKNLKAIAVRGQQKIPFADSDGVSNFGSSLRDELKTHRYAQSMGKDGTAGGLMGLNSTGGLPTRNFQQGVFEGAEKISAAAINDNILTGRRGCYACLIRCKPEVTVRGKYNVNPAYGGPEYETLASLGSNCGIDDLQAIARGNELCNSYGLDSISTGVSISFLMECFQRGIVTENDTGGIKTTFGNAEAMLQLIEMIARKEGIGKVLAEGVARASVIIGKGADEFALHVKGQELPMHEPRLKPALGVGYAVSPTGADHCHNIHDTDYATRIPSFLRSLGILNPVPAQDLSPAKIRLLVYGSLWQHALNCLVFCQFVPVPPTRSVELTRHVTGWNYSVWEVMKTAERCVAMMRVFNARAGKTRSDDWLPHRFFTPFASGPLKGIALKEDEFRKALDTYYEMTGCDKVTGIPTAAKLQELDIEWVAKQSS